MNSICLKHCCFRKKLKETAPDDILLVIVGNKIDLCENEKCRAVKRRDAEIMAEVNDILDLLC